MCTKHEASKRGVAVVNGFRRCGRNVSSFYQVPVLAFSSPKGQAATASVRVESHLKCTFSVQRGQSDFSTSKNAKKKS